MEANEKLVITWFNKGRRVCLSTLFIIAFSGGAATADEAAQLETEASLRWDSKYVSRGRDQLDDGGIFSPEIGLSYGNSYVGAWFAVGDSVNYRELNLSVGHVFSAGPVELDLGYTWLWFEDERTDENEFTAIASWQAQEWLGFDADYIYNTLEDGWAIDAVVRGNFAVGNFTISPYALAGFDFGFSSPEHNGIAEIQIGAETSIPLGDKSELSIYAAHSLAQRDKSRDGLGDLSWIGVGLHFHLP